ncbi:MAG: hypothetical protein RQ736_11305 [Thiogranum sp.]|nr:hypothetical protein [Thiogranum sp.]
MTPPFAAHLGWTYARLNEVINGRRQVSADSALALGEALKTGFEFWLNLAARLGSLARHGFTPESATVEKGRIEKSRVDSVRP